MHKSLNTSLALDIDRDPKYDVVLYVDITKGSDAVGNGTSGLPFRTIQHATEIAPIGNIHRTSIYVYSGLIAQPLDNTTYSDHIIFVSGKVISIILRTSISINGIIARNNANIDIRPLAQYEASLYITYSSEFPSNAAVESFNGSMINFAYFQTIQISGFNFGAYCQANSSLGFASDNALLDMRNCFKGFASYNGSYVEIRLYETCMKLQGTFQILADCQNGSTLLFYECASLSVTLNSNGGIAFHASAGIIFVTNPTALTITGGGSRYGASHGGRILSGGQSSIPLY